MKENILAAGIVIFFFGLIVWVLVILIQNVDQKVERYCRADCNEAHGKYLRSIVGNRAEDQCICKIGTEVKNIW